MCLGPCTGWLLPLVTYHLGDPSLLHFTANNRVGENWKKHLNSGPKIQIGFGDENSLGGK